MALGQVRFDFQRPAVRRFRLIETPQTAQCITQVVMGLGQTRRDQQCLVETACRFLWPFLIQQYDAEVGMKRLRTGIKADGLPVAGLGLGQPPRHLQSLAQIVMNDGLGRLQGHRSAKTRLCDVRTVEVNIDHTQVKPRLGVLRIFGAMMFERSPGLFRLALLQQLHG